MALSKEEIRKLQDLVVTDEWQVYLTWLAQRMEATFQEMLRYETDQNKFIQLHARLRTLMDISYFFELELIGTDSIKDLEKKKDAQEKLHLIDKGYKERFLRFLKNLHKEPVDG